MSSRLTCPTLINSKFNFRSPGLTCNISPRVCEPESDPVIWNDLCFLRGAFGVVKRVVHRRTNEVFAAKFLPLQSSTRTRAFQERDLLSRLAHPRVACLLDFFCTRRTLVLITEMYPLLLNAGVWLQPNYIWVTVQIFTPVSSCCSHGLLDHLLLKGSVSEKEVEAPTCSPQNSVHIFYSWLEDYIPCLIAGAVIHPANPGGSWSHSQHEHHAPGH